MKQAVLLLAFCVFTAAHAADLTEAQLKEIVAKPHSPRLALEAMRIFPNGRTYDITVKSTGADGAAHESKVVCFEKWVDGKYIVSEVRSEDQGTSYQIISFDAESSTYWQHTLTSEGLVGTQLGIRIGATRAMAWRILPGSKAQPAESLESTVNTDAMTKCHSVYVKEGKVLYWTDIEAVVTKTDFSIADLNKKDAATELLVAVNLGKPEDYLTTKFGVYREGKRIREMLPEKADGARLRFKLTESKNPADAILKTDVIVVGE